ALSPGRARSVARSATFSCRRRKMRSSVSLRLTMTSMEESASCAPSKPAVLAGRTGVPAAGAGAAAGALAAAPTSPALAAGGARGGGGGPAGVRGGGLVRVRGGSVGGSLKGWRPGEPGGRGAADAAALAGACEGVSPPLHSDQATTAQAAICRKKAKEGLGT